jgi:hypothetical protein
MMEHKNKIPNWLHYWNIAQTRPDLKEFKDLLVVNANNPNANIGENKVRTIVPETIQVEQQTPDGVKLVEKVIKKRSHQNIQSACNRTSAERNKRRWKAQLTIR